MAAKHAGPWVLLYEDVRYRQCNRIRDVISQCRFFLLIGQTRGSHLGKGSSYLG